MAKRNVELRETTVYVCVNATGYPFEFTASQLRRESIAKFEKSIMDWKHSREEYGTRCVKAKLVPLEAQTSADGRQ